MLDRPNKSTARIAAAGALGFAGWAASTKGDVSAMLYAAALACAISSLLMFVRLRGTRDPEERASVKRIQGPRPFLVVSKRDDGRSMEPRWSKLLIENTGDVDALALSFVDIELDSCQIQVDGLVRVAAKANGVELDARVTPAERPKAARSEGFADALSWGLLVMANATYSSVEAYIEASPKWTRPIVLQAAYRSPNGTRYRASFAIPFDVPLRRFDEVRMRDTQPAMEKAT